MSLHISSKKRLGLVYLSGFLMAVHFASISYVNSSLLKQFVGNGFLNILYVLGSALSLLSLFFAPALTRKYGNVLVFAFFVILEALAVVGMGASDTAILIIALFVIHLAADSMLYFCLDLNLEQETKEEGSTGSKRGILLTFSNIAWIISPLALTFLVIQNNFSSIYFLSGLALIPLFFIIILFFKDTTRVPLVNVKIIPTLKSLWKEKDKARIIGVQLILNFFYSWMIIYVPLLLNGIGFTWQEIGLLFTIMLLPFLLFELPAGILADKKIGEREILITGFLLMFVSTLTIPILTTPLFWSWATVLFVTRVGASLIEIGSESYFFKQVKKEDTGPISLFRSTRPLSFIIAPIIALPVVHLFSYSTSFYFLATFVIIGLLVVPKVDTR